MSSFPIALRSVYITIRFREHRSSSGTKLTYFASMQAAFGKTTDAPLI